MRSQVIEFCGLFNLCHRIDRLVWLSLILQNLIASLKPDPLPTCCIQPRQDIWIARLILVSRWINLHQVTEWYEVSRCLLEWQVLLCNLIEIYHRRHRFHEWLGSCHFWSAVFGWADETWTILTTAIWGLAMTNGWHFLETLCLERMRFLSIVKGTIWRSLARLYWKGRVE